MTSSAAEPRASAGKRLVTSVASLASLVGAHPDALLQIWSGAGATDPAELGDAPRGLILALVPGADLFLVTRPIFRALSKGLFPWQGKAFDHGGNSGQNVFLGQRAFRFRAEVAASSLDGAPALVLDYSGHANPWPVRAFADELRTVGDGIALGRAIFKAPGGVRPLFWFGLESAG